jgi:DNA-directed RNA polymerase specialized sigma24 family protein
MNTTYTQEIALVIGEAAAREVVRVGRIGMRGLSREDSEDLAQEMFLNALTAKQNSIVINNLAAYTATGLAKREMRQSGALAVANMAKTFNAANGRKAAFKLEIDAEDCTFDVATEDVEELDSSRSVQLEDYLEAALDVARQGGKAVAEMSEITGGKAITIRRGQQLIKQTREILESNQAFKQGLKGQGGLFDAAGGV